MIMYIVNNAQDLVGQYMPCGAVFNPVQDITGVWVVSLQEAAHVAVVGQLEYQQREVDND